MALFNVNTKKNIDTIVPIAGTALVYYYIIRKENVSIKDKVIYVALCWLALYLGTSTITKNIWEKNLNLMDKAVTHGQGGAIGIGSITIDLVKYSNELHADIDGLSLIPWNRNESLYKRIAELDSANLKAVAQQYQSDWGESLRDALEGESYPNFLNGTANTVKGIINRLKNLGL